MKNIYCELQEKDIRKLPERFQGFLLSPFYSDNKLVYVPENTFKDMVKLITEYAQISDCKEDLNGR